MEIPRTISNPVDGSTITFLKLPTETGGEYLQIEVTTMPHTGGPPMHYHPTATEQFEVQDGVLYVTVSGEEHVLSAGEKLVVPPGTPHTFRTEAEGSRVIGTVTPPGRFVEFLTSEYALMRAGKLGEGAEGDLLAIAPWIHEFRDVSRATGPINYLFAVLAPLGRVLGNPRIPAYPTEKDAVETKSSE
ncbi:cupin domain-containing protein [Haloferax sp. DFSO60]|uniref:cupin domain-containing protein n=1 Tax=Haloferax sp. DFSO60 TaxID=3388652 RepID=UPI003979EC6A